VRHLARLESLAERFEPGLVSEHLSWSALSGAHFAELLPLPYTEESLALVCRHVDIAQHRLGMRLLIENPSSYLRFRHSTIPEWEFMAEVAKRTGCGILCDVNNVFVSACNHGFDARLYLRSLPAERIGEIHLAGHTRRTLEDGRCIRIDDHGSRVCGEVWELYALALALFGRVPTLVEWDNSLPPLGVLLEEAAHAQRILDMDLAHAVVA
jgi:uncharacterized protein (UPF0276 family)